MTALRDPAGQGRGSGQNYTWAELATGYAQDFVNRKVPYVWGGASQVAADCSGFINRIALDAGISLGGFTGVGHGPTSQATAGYGVAVPFAGKNRLGNAKPGDVLIFNEADGPDSHEALYAGVIHGTPMDYEESTTGQPAHLIPVDIANLATIRQIVSPTTGKPTGPGVTGTLNGKTPPAIGDTGTGGTGRTSSGTTTSSSGATRETLFNRSTLTRVGIGIMAVLVLLIALDQIAKPKNGAGQVILEGGGNTIGRAQTAGRWVGKQTSTAGAGTSSVPGRRSQPEARPDEDRPRHTPPPPGRHLQVAGHDDLAAARAAKAAYRAPTSTAPPARRATTGTGPTAGWEDEWA